MKVSELKALVNEHGHEPFFFSPKTMRVFGDTMSNYGVRSAVITVEYDANGNWMDGKTEAIEVWELYRKRAVNGNLRKSAYFDKQVFCQRSPIHETGGKPTF